MWIVSCSEDIVMSDRKIKDRILDEYLNNASPEDIKVLNRLLKLMEQKPDALRNGLNVDIKRLARDMSSQISRQMGMADINIKKMSRELVAQMARHYKPGISQKEVDEIVNQMVPEKKYTGFSDKIPYEMLRTMIVQYVRYTAGVMPEKELSQMPEGWSKKYWDSFSPEIRTLIKAYLQNGIDNRNFWLSVEKLYKKK
jgi:hypothetical protein